MATLRLVLLAVAFALATATFGWWTVAVLGLVWGWLGGRGRGVATTAAVAAGLGWAGLLAWAALRGPVAELATKVGGVMELPAWGLIALTIVFPMALAGSGALILAGGSTISGDRGNRPWRTSRPS